jgi:hypothetical protein
MAYPPAQSVSASSVDRGLAQALGPGRIIAVHRRSCTLETLAGALITLADPACGNGPQTVLARQAGWLAGERFWPAGASGLRFEHGPALDWRRAAVWAASDIAPGGPPVFRHSAALLRVLAQGQIQTGMLPVLLKTPPVSPQQQALADRAAPLLAALPDPAAARQLIGLGPGLTPAGDDLLVGLLLVLYYVNHSALKPLRPIMAQAATTRLSRAMLGWAAQGEAGEHVLLLLRDLFSLPEPQAFARLPQVLAHGATSGADLIAGIVLGLRMI